VSAQLPLMAIRRFCLECQGGSPKSVRICPDAACPLWTWRLAALPGEGPQEEDKTSILRAAFRAVRRQCLACAGHRRDVRTCSAREGCSLWSCRFGVHPKTYKAVRRRFFAPKALSLF